MKMYQLTILMVVACAVGGRASTTPLTLELQEGVATEIICEFTEIPKKSEVPVFENKEECAQAPGVYRYRLLLPKGYHSDPKKSWPCVFVMSPSGNASMGNMKGYLEQHGFVVVMLVEAKNGPWAPIVGNFLSAHDDVVERVRIEEGRKYATGFSGGARGSSLFVQLRPGFGGLILQGAGAAFVEGDYYVKDIKRNQSLKVAMIMGDSDKNKTEIERLGKALSSRQLSIFSFTGGHSWAPADIFAQAMDWVLKE